MITDGLVKAFAWVLHLILAPLPVLHSPEWLSSTAGAVGTVFGYAGSLGAWFPVPFVASVVAGVLAAWSISFGIKLIRMVASFVTLGGGAT